MGENIALLQNVEVFIVYNQLNLKPGNIYVYVYYIYI